MQKAQLRAILWEAWSSQYGIEVAVSDIAAFKRRFYSERAAAREEGINEFDVLQLLTPPLDVTGKLWIVKLEKANEQVGPTEEGGAREENDPPL